MSRKYVLAMFLSVFVSVCSAQHMNEKDSPCANVAITTDLVQCLSKARDSSDAKLNTIYRRLEKALAASDKELLTRSERLWIQYRDANCTAERALYDGGTGAYPAYLGCLEAMTRERVKELEITYAVRLDK